MYHSGIYDEKWIQSTVLLLQKCKEYGLMVFMDPHQDVVCLHPRSSVTVLVLVAQIG